MFFVKVLPAQSLFVESKLSTSSASINLTALIRQERFSPLRYRVILIPGSGCTGFGLDADRYFESLLHAEVVIIHKPGVALFAGLNPKVCPQGFLEYDSLSHWRDDAIAALNSLKNKEDVPQILVGVSEGGELLPYIAESVPNLSAIIMLSSTGLDPLIAGQMQAQRSDKNLEWAQLERIQKSNLPDAYLYEGRSLRYWRDLWGWKVEAALKNIKKPILQVWGTADKLQPLEGYLMFKSSMPIDINRYCSYQFEGADHGLQSKHSDGVQQLWHWLENWARFGDKGLCDFVPAQ